MAITYFGGASAASGYSSFGGNYIHGQAHSAPVSGNITVARGRLEDNGSGDSNAKVLIYANSSGVPGALLGESNAVALPFANPMAMVNFTFAVPVAVVSGTSYFIMLFEDAAGGGVKFEYNAIGTLKFKTATYPTVPNPFGTASSTAGYQAYLEAGIDDAVGGAAFVPRVIAAY